MQGLRTKIAAIRSKIPFLLIAALIFANAFIWYGARAEERGVLKVAFLDIGQGDSIFIESPSGAQALIDGGPNKKVLQELGAVMPLYDNYIDVIVATHPDKDHIGGLPEVVSRYGVGMFLESGVKCRTATCFELEKVVDEKGVQKIIARRGMIVDLGGGAFLSILYPDREVADVSDTNDGSIVAKLIYGNNSFMLTGDAPQGVERVLLSYGPAGLKSDVLKSGHHGSKTSSAPQFVAAVAPAYGIISAGKNNQYGHPHQETLDTLNKFGVKILSTIDLGRIIFSSDGESLFVN